MAFAVFTDETRQHFAAVGRLSDDPDRERTEYAILVRTDLHGHGVGYALMHKLIDYAKNRGVKQMFGHVLRENKPMLDLCAELGFTRHQVPGEPTVFEMQLDL